MRERELMGGLRYIANSPPREHGGFHPQTVAIAKRAILEIRRLKSKLRKRDRKNDDWKCGGAPMGLA